MEYTPEQIRKEIAVKLGRHFGCEPYEASREEIFKASALVMRDILTARLIETENKRDESKAREVHYMSLEFLLGRSFLNNAYNLGLTENMREALSGMGVDFKDLLETEPDAGLGNGGLGRLAACYIDSMASLGINATGYSIRYEHGLFKQRIVDGQQSELPDSWIEVGEVWLLPRMDEVREVLFDGQVKESWDQDHMRVSIENATTVLAVPYDMPISGYDTDNVCVLRLWSATSPVEMDMKLFSRGEYLKAVEQHAMAETISKILYPDDKHIEGKSLRIKQQYFFVSATVQDIVAKHKAKYGTLRNFAEKHVIQINDTHPAMVIPELMRILMDEEGYSWEDAWETVIHSVAYTNHTVMPEALEQWPCTLFERHIPRIWAILHEINQRFCAQLWEKFPGRFDLAAKLGIICDNMVKMANLSVIASYSVNGVSALHSDILKTRVFPEYNEMFPGRFTNVTNGIAHRRWLCEINPGLTELLKDCIGDRFIKEPERLSDFKKYADDEGVLSRLGEIKKTNKERCSEFLVRSGGQALDTLSLFDVQVKRIHEYKRQLLNVLRILSDYIDIKENPNMDYVPRTFIFGAKAFPGYYIAKQIIRLINSVADYISKDPAVRDLIRVVFVENYRVTAAESIMPASEVSEQISLAGKEASGTGNMKFMINGAVTVGTLDGANVEINEAVGKDNIFIFGLNAEEAEKLQGHYNPSGIYASDPRVKAVLGLMGTGFGDGASYHELASSLLMGPNPDAYMLLADFESYLKAQRAVSEAYRDPVRWNRMSLINIAESGRFSSDRSVSEYAEKIWKV